MLIQIFIVWVILTIADFTSSLRPFSHKVLPGTNKDCTRSGLRKYFGRSKKSEQRLYDSEGGFWDSVSRIAVGGAIGVLSTAAILEFQRITAKPHLEYINDDDKKCPYCQGTGQIVCGKCFGSKIVNDSIRCSCCDGNGFIECLNCKGVGQVG